MEMLKLKIPYVESSGVQAFIGQRRRYGTTTYTWVRFVDAAGKEHVRDPWPCVMPAKAEVREVCDEVAKTYVVPKPG